MSAPGPSPKTDVEEHLDQQLDEANQLIRRSGDAATSESRTTRLFNATVEDLTLTNQGLEQDLGKLSHALRDYRLQKDAELLTREIQLCEAETELARLQLTVTENASTISKNEELKLAIEELTKCHGDIRSQLATCDKELSYKTEQLHNSEANTIELKRYLEETTNFCGVLKDLLTYTEDLCKSFEELAKRTEQDKNALKTENAELWKVLQDALLMLKEEREAMSQRLLSATREKEEAEQRFNEITPQLLPSWFHEQAQRQANGSIPESILLLTSNCLRDERSARADLEGLFMNIGLLAGSRGIQSDASLKLPQKLVILVQIRRMIDLSVNLIHYIITSKFSAWTEIACTNALALKKDRGEIIWCYQLLKDIGDMILWVSEYFNWAAEIEVDGLVRLESNIVLPRTSSETTFLKLFDDVTNQMKLLTESAMTSQLSSASSTRAIGTLSSAIFSFLEEQNYTCRWARDNITDSRLLPTTPVVIQTFRILGGFLVFLTENVVPEEIKTSYVQEVHKITINSVTSLKEQWLDAIMLSFTNSQDSVSIITSFFEQGPTEQPPYAHEIINVCTAVESIGKLNDPKERWSLANIPVSSRSDITISSNSQESIASALKAFEHLVFRLNDGALVPGEFCRFRIINSKKNHEAPLNETHNKIPNLPLTSENQLSGDTNSDLAALEREITVVKSKLELYQLKEEEFSKAASANDALIEELRKKNEMICSLQASENSCRSLLEEKLSKLEAAETALEESEHMRRLQTRLPPDLAAFELAKTRAVIKKLQRSLLESTEGDINRSWAKIENRLEKPKPKPSRLDINEFLRIRENLVEIALRNPGLTALLQNGKKDLHVQDILVAQASNRNEKLSVTRELCRIETQKGHITKTQSHLYLTPSQLALIARVPVQHPHPSGKVIMDLHETQRWIESTIF